MASDRAAYFLDSPIVDSPKLCQDIFSILESRFLFGSASPFSNPASPAIAGVGKVRILSIDGGSPHLAASALFRLESDLRRLSGDSSASIPQFFDLAVGSGSGALLASLLFASNLSASDASQILKSQKGSRFGRIFKRESKNKAIREALGEMSLKDATKPLLITSYDLNTGAPFVFSRADAVESDGFDFRIRDVCEAATCHSKKVKEVKSLDGGRSIRVADAGLNPTAVAITHVMHNKQEFPFVNGLEDLFVLSIGGDGAHKGDVVSIARACQADLVDQAVAMAFGQNRKSNYVRIQGNGINGGTTTEELLSETSVESILFQGKKLMKETNEERLEWAADELIKEQHRRLQSKIPTVFIKPSVTPSRSSSSSGMTLTTVLTGSSESPRY